MEHPCPSDDGGIAKKEVDIQKVYGKIAAILFVIALVLVFGGLLVGVLLMVTP